MRGALSLSDIVLAKRMEDLKGPADDSDPFQFDGKRMVPTLSHSITAGQKLTVFLFAYPRTSDSHNLSLHIRCTRDGKLVSNQLIPSTPAPDQSGRVQVRFGITAIPGSYELMVKATQGHDSVERSLDYSVSATKSY
jgi:hypothetical protein